MAVLRAACYSRVSTSEQAKYGYSIAAQVAILNQHCTENNIKIVDHYTDEGVSAGKPYTKRPEMLRLLEDVKDGKIDIILFTRLDRWYRSTKLYYQVQEILDKHNVVWDAVQESYSTQDASGRFKVNIMLAVAETERDRGSERITTVLENKRKNKEACFGGVSLPFGYMKQKDEQGFTRLVKDPDTKQACEEFWDIILKHNNLNKAILYMGTEYGIQKNWKSWKRITTNTLYYGEYMGVTEFCEPYVSKEDFERFRDRKTVKHIPSGYAYLFRGLMRCPECGHKMCGDLTKKSYGYYKSYRCPKRGRECSNQNSISERLLEKQLLNKIKELLQKEISRVELEQAQTKPKQKNNIKSLKEKHRRLTFAYMAGNLSDEEYMKMDADFKAQIAQAESVEPPKPKDIAPLKELLETDIESIYITFTDEEKQRFWQSLVKEIIMDGKQVDKVIFF
jgi:DNA invertase Pin-like site-specific DNA recombinase